MSCLVFSGSATSTLRNLALPKGQFELADEVARARSSHVLGLVAKVPDAELAGEPEDQIRAPFEQLVSDLAVLCGHKPGRVVTVSELTVSELRTRPDHAVTVGGALVGVVKLKAPGKGADPRRFRDAHDKQQWQRLQALPNLLYTDGVAFSL
ncbi:MAG: hypothetical protein Q8M01_01795 [Rubrivivax sp.]|nr:hypothetical protein [Rubrivivax sp.]